MVEGLECGAPEDPLSGEGSLFMDCGLACSKLCSSSCEEANLKRARCSHHEKREARVPHRTTERVEGTMLVLNQPTPPEQLHVEVWMEGALASLFSSKTEVYLSKTSSST